MPSRCNTRERPRIEPKTDIGTLSAADSLRFHWPEYLMEAGEAGLYLFSACTVATLLWHPASPVQQSLPSDAVRRMLMGLAMGATIIAIVRSLHSHVYINRPPCFNAAQSVGMRSAWASRM